MSPIVSAFLVAGAIATILFFAGYARGAWTAIATHSDAEIEVDDSADVQAYWWQIAARCRCRRGDHRPGRCGARVHLPWPGLGHRYCRLQRSWPSSSRTNRRLARRRAIERRAAAGIPPMQIGIWLPVYGGWLRTLDQATGPDVAACLAIAQQAEALGFDFLYASENLLNCIHGPTEGVADAWSLLAAIAATTSRVGLAGAIKPGFPLAFPRRPHDRHADASGRPTADDERRVRLVA